MNPSNISYSLDSDPFEGNFSARNMSQTYDFETHKNLSHKKSVLLQRNPCKLTLG